MIFIQNFVQLFAVSAPWLLLGLLFAGLINQFFSAAYLHRQLGDDSRWAVLKAALIGAPLPLCSCGVIPAAIGLRRSGATKPATISFLVSTPETGVDSVSISYALLGPVFAVIRPVAAVISAIYAGVLTQLVANRQRVENKSQVPTDDGEATSKESTCCAAKRAKGAEVSVAKTGECSSNKDAESKSVCCSADISDSKIATDATNKSFARVIDKLKAVIGYASGKLLIDLSGWLLIGLLLAAAINSWLPAGWLAQWGQGPAALLIMALIGIPMYICATASTPVAAGFLAAGVSPGAVLVFLLAGPATNLSTMGMIKKEMGVPVLSVYLFSVISASISIGLLLNWLIPQQQLALPAYLDAQAAHSVSILESLSAMVLAGLMVRNYAKKHLSGVLTAQS